MEATSPSVVHTALACRVASLFLFVGWVQAASRPSDAELAAVTERGVLLAQYDAAAWEATDAVMATHPMVGRIANYIARKVDTGWVVDFGQLSKTEDKFLVAYEAVEVGNPSRFEVKILDPPRGDTGWNLAAARAVKITLRDFGEASRPYNVAVLPIVQGGMYVYHYPAQTKEGVYPLGADVRYHVSQDGTTIVERRQMHQTVIESDPARPDLRVAVGYHSHVLSDMPEDTDVLLVLTRVPRVPEIVVTPKYMFTIDVRGKISLAHRP